MVIKRLWHRLFGHVRSSYWISDCAECWDADEGTGRCKHVDRGEVREWVSGEDPQECVCGLTAVWLPDSDVKILQRLKKEATDHA